MRFQPIQSAPGRKFEEPLAISWMLSSCAAHRDGGYQRELRVVLSVLVAELPGPVDLVAQAPHFDVPRLLAPVLGALLRPVGRTRLVAVLHPLPRLVRRAESGVDAQIRLGADALAIFQEFVGAEAIRFQCAPGVIGTRGPLVARPDAIRPVVARREIPARPAQDRNAQRLHHIENVLAESVCVRQRAAFFENTAVNAPSQVLREIAEDVRVHLADYAIGIDSNLRRRSLRRQPTAGNQQERTCQ